MSMAASPPASELADGYGPIVVMGVSGCGKTSVGKLLADRLGRTFVEGDSVHPPVNVRKMRMGIALEDSDRWPWLDALGRRLAEETSVIMSCSALKWSYRDRLRRLAGRPLTFVFLRGDRTLLAARMAGRNHEYMPLSLLDSQLSTLEPPVSGPQGEPDVIALDIDQPLEVIVSTVITRMTAARKRAHDTDFLEEI